MEKVMVNADEIRKDLARMGLQAKQVSISMGKNGNYLAEMLSRSATRPLERKTVEMVEKALFREPGAYCIEINEDKKTEEKPAEGMKAEWDGVRKDLNEMYIMQKAIYTELRSIHSDMKELLFDIKNNTSTSKEYAKRVHDDCYKLTQLWGGK